ncbi:MAG: hybrid sensor histidine kinase/response regulator [Elainellaceae cyanobacterium]
MTSDPIIRAQGYQYFLQEAPELLQILEQGLLTLQEDSSINKVNTLMRATHTLKGAAASLDLETIATMAHSLEDVFRALCRPDVSVNGEIDALLFEGFECLRSALRAELTGAALDEDDILNRTAAIFAQLQDSLGVCFDQDVPPPTSTELGFDVTQSIFELGVSQRLDQLAAVLDAGLSAEILTVLETQAEVFFGLGESLNLPGFGDIAQATLAALAHQPEQLEAIAQLALQDFQAGQAAVLAGDRTQGGQPSEPLQALAHGEHQPADVDDALDHSAAVVEAASPSIQGHEAVDASGDTATPDHAAAVEDTSGSGASSAAGGMAIPGIHKLFHWIRRSAQASPGQAQDPEAGILSASPDGAVEGLDHTIEPLLDHPNSVGDDGIGDGADADIDRAADVNADADILLENIWGADSSDIDDGAEADPNPAPLSVSADAIAPMANTEPSNAEPAADPEVLRLTEVSPAYSRSPDQQPNTPNPGAMPSTVRIQVEHLDQLNYAIGELLTNHNQQSLQAEQIQTAMHTLYARLQQHQNLLSQLQDWIDAPPMPLSHYHPSDCPASASPPALPSIAQPQAQPLGMGALPQSPPTSVRFDALELDQYSEPDLVIQSLLDDAVQLVEAVDAVELFTRRSRQAQEKQGRLLLKTRDALIEGRMSPLEQLFERFPRVLQQLETLHHKPVELTLRGTEVLVDKAIGEKLYDPILHLVRNAFDHGIEPVTVRQQRSKPKAGQLEIAAHHQGKHLVIEVCDDGQGIDFERIRQHAVERQLISPEQAYGLSPAQLTDFLFEPGFSTAAQISSLSGRGVGLDVVRNQLQALQGEISVTSAARQGTTFTLRIPLSLTIARLLICHAEMRTYALLPDAVEQIMIPQAGQVQQREHSRSLWWGEGEGACLVPVYRLSELLDYPAQIQRLPAPPNASPNNKTSDNSATPHVLLIRHQDALIGLEIDQMLGEQELVIRPLNPLLKTQDYIYGASILADGRLTLVLDSAALAEAVSSLQAARDTTDNSAHPPLDSPTGALTNLPRPAHSSPDSELGANREGNTLLIVDDSITTRQTLSLTLQKAGYHRVIQAQDGQEAINQLLGYPDIQLVICDIEMPRMNGFEFLQHCQLDPELARIPVVMLSSRSSGKHRSLAEQLGAIAYISKPYLEHQLLTMVAEVLSANVPNPISG